MLTDTRHSKNAKVYPQCGSRTAWTGGLWKERLDTIMDATVPFLQHMFEEKEISHVVENFRICAGDAKGDFDGTVFGDGDFYKWMESAVYTAVKTENRTLMNRIDEFIDLIGRAQQPDGYLSTKQIIGEIRQNGVSRMGDINDFEVYNFGHMFTSACLHYRMTGKDSFLKIAVKTCGYLEKLYDTAEKTGEVQTAVCPSHYMGLAELYRTTGDERYLRLLNKAILLRDSVKNGMDDNQDRIPLLSHDRIHGHAVRANYLYAGLADLCLELGNEDTNLPEDRREKYLAVLHRVWDSLIHKKMYITGGCGALYNGVSPYGNFFMDQKIHQAYGYEYQLPNVTAYNETCASLGGVFWAYRMFQLEPEAVYFDVLERMMLNVNLAAVSLDGKRFFYENALRREKELDYKLVWPLTRSEYILSYCCPPNLARTVAESEEYAYMLDRDGVWTGLYGDSRAEIRLENGAGFTLLQKTDYPYDGRICFSLEKSGETPFLLHLRIPGWVMSGTLELAGAERIPKEEKETCLLEASGKDGGFKSCGPDLKSTMKITDREAGSYLAIRVTDPENANITLVLDMPVRYTQAHSMVEEAVGQACVERGPLVFCAEGMDADMESLSDLYLDPFASFETDWMEIEGRRILSLQSMQYCADRTGYDRDALYQTLAVCPSPEEAASFNGSPSGGTAGIRPPALTKRSVRMIPYFAWDNREFDQMRIWFPVAMGTNPQKGPLRISAKILDTLPGADPVKAESLFAEAMQGFDRKIVVLDDDPTGTQTVHDISVYTDWEEDSIRQGFEEENSMFFILTNSRSFSEEKTEAVHREIARRVEKISRETGKKYFLISRGDSTLRGHYPLEMSALAEGRWEDSRENMSACKNPGGPEGASPSRIDGEILCPFFPEGGRYTIGDIHYVKEELKGSIGGPVLTPAGMTEFAKDKTFGYRSSDLKEYAEEKSAGRVRAKDCISVSLEELAALDVEKIKEKLMSANDRTVIVVNAVAYADLKVFCAAMVLAMKEGKHFLARTAAAFTAVMGRVTGMPLLTRRKLSEAAGGKKDKKAGGLVIIGSHVKKTTGQLACLKESGLPLVYMEFDVSRPEEERERASAFAEKAIREGQTAVIYTSRRLLAPEKLSKEEKLALSVRISDALAGLVSGLHTKPAFVIAKGGITSSDVGTKGLQVKKALVMGQIKKGIPVWLTGPESRFPSLPYVIFPGNVGEEGTLKEIVEELLAGEV